MFAYGSQIRDGKDGAQIQKRREGKSPASILSVPAYSYIFWCGSLPVKEKINKIAGGFGGHQAHLEKGICATALSNSTRPFSSVWTNVGPDFQFSCATACDNGVNCISNWLEETEIFAQFKSKYELKNLFKYTTLMGNFNFPCWHYPTGQEKSVLCQLFCYLNIIQLLKVILLPAQTSVLEKLNIRFLKLTADFSTFRLQQQLVIIYYLLHCNSLRL